MLIKLELVNKKDYQRVNGKDKPIYLFVDAIVWFNDNYYNDPNHRMYGVFDPSDCNWGLWFFRKDVKLKDFVISSKVLGDLRNFLESK